MYEQNKQEACSTFVQGLGKEREELMQDRTLEQARGVGSGRMSIPLLTSLIAGVQEEEISIEGFERA